MPHVPVEKDLEVSEIVLCCLFALILCALVVMIVRGCRRKRSQRQQDKGIIEPNNYTRRDREIAMAKSGTYRASIGNKNVRKKPDANINVGDTLLQVIEVIENSDIPTQINADLNVKPIDRTTCDTVTSNHGHKVTSDYDTNHNSSTDHDTHHSFTSNHSSHCDSYDYGGSYDYDDAYDS